MLRMQGRGSGLLEPYDFRMCTCLKEVQACNQFVELRRMLLQGGDVARHVLQRRTSGPESRGSAR